MIIKQFLSSATIIFALISCSAQKNSVVQQVDAFGNNQTIEDSVIRRLREDNDLVIAYALRCGFAHNVLLDPGKL